MRATHKQPAGPEHDLLTGPVGNHRPGTYLFPCFVPHIVVRGFQWERTPVNVALLDDQPDPSARTFVDVSHLEIIAPGYRPGGEPLTGKRAVQTSAGGVQLRADDVVFGGTGAAATHAVIYEDRSLIAWIDFGGPVALDGLRLAWNGGPVISIGVPANGLAVVA